MKKELYTLGDKSRKVIIQHDDLKYDGDNLIIPSYWAATIKDYLDKVDKSTLPIEEAEDFNTFVDFIEDVNYQKSTPSGN